MKHEEIIGRLECNKALIQGLVCGIGENQARWRPEPGKWSILEVINHLYDEECEDFRQRLDLTLHMPGKVWPAIDPETWVIEKKYNERNFKKSVKSFMSERQQSVAWLKGLKSPDWNSAYDHEVFGSISAGDILCAWLAHDYFHARQISNILIQYAECISAPFSIRYALG